MVMVERDRQFRLSFELSELLGRVVESGLDDEIFAGFADAIEPCMRCRAKKHRVAVAAAKIYFDCFCRAGEAASERNRYVVGQRNGLTTLDVLGE